MPASTHDASANDELAERARRTRQIQDAFARGQAALAAGDKADAVRWLDRAHRLAPDDGTILLVLASATLGDDNPKAAASFARVVASADVRDAWAGLAAARLLTGDLTGARAALAEVLSRHVVRPDIAGLADQVTWATAAAGWCGLTREGAVMLHPVGPEPIDVRMDGKLVGPEPIDVRLDSNPDRGALRHDPDRLAAHQGHGDASVPRHARPRGDLNQPDTARGPEDGAGADTKNTARLADNPGGDRARAQRAVILPPAWKRARSVTVTAGDRHLIGSPISLRAIWRIEGQVEAWDDGIRGWAWHPGDPETDPRLTVAAGPARKAIVATGSAASIPGLAPLARPRSFALSWAELPGVDAPVHVRGRDGRRLAGSPVAGPQASDNDVSRAKPRRRPAVPALTAASSPSPVVARRDAANPLPPARRRLDLARWRDADTETVILVTHDDGGGVERRVRASVASHEACGRRAIVLRPMKPRNGSAGVVVGGGGSPDARFDLPREQPALLRLLRGMKPVAAELHHLLNHDPSVFETIRALGVPYDAHTHDYAWFCPRIALVGRGDRYCGEPAPAACETCITELGGYLHEDIRVSTLLDRSRAILSGARGVIAPSDDAALRLARHFPGISPIVIPHEDDSAVDEPPPLPRVTGTVLVCVSGAIGLHKGFHVLLACARDAAKRALDLAFVVAGTTIDDQRLIDTGRVFVTGPYQPEEAVPLIRAQGAALALLPSIWPETWCLGLAELWRAGLRVAAFDIGAPAERIRRTGRGFLLPLGLAPPAINDALLNAARGRSFLPIRRSSAYKPFH